MSDVKNIQKIIQKNKPLNFKNMKTIKLNKVKQIAFLKLAFVLVAVVIIAMSMKTQHVVNGRITDVSNNALPGVNVIIKGTTSGIVTDIDGKYTIIVPDDTCILVYSYIGYEKQEINVSGRNMIDVVMNEEVKALDEVVVVGYGVQRKSELTGAVSTDRKEIRKFKQTLKGNCAGIQISNSFSRKNNTSYAPVYLDPSTESYSKINENGFKSVKVDPVSTFSIDVDRASYSNIRRYINQGELPPVDAVKIEEMVNYFEYDYPQPTDEHPFSINT
jgi:Ca-activated chloride channel homolog